MSTKMSLALHAAPRLFMPVCSSHTVVGATSAAGELYQPTKAVLLPVSCSSSCAEKSHSGLKVAGSVLASATESSTPAPSLKSNSSCRPTSFTGLGSGMTTPSGCVTAAAALADASEQTSAPASAPSAPRRQEEEMFIEPKSLEVKAGRANEFAHRDVT